jgi:hypothetical protein
MISIFLAKFLGLFYVIVGVLMFVNRPAIVTTLNELIKSPGLMSFAGFLTLATGVLLVLLHNIWQMNWTIVITILAWVALLQGIVRSGFPQTGAKMMARFVDNQLAYYAVSLGILIIGIFLSYHGFK